MIKQSTNHFKVKLTATLLLLLLTCWPAFAQEQKGPEPEKFRQLIRESDYIFEGKALKETEREYASEEGDKFYYSILIEVTKVLKGDLTPGTIELISSKVAPSSFIKDGVKHSTRVYDSYNGVPITYNSQYIFFAKATDLLPDPKPKGVAIDNPQKVDVEASYYSLLELAQPGIQYHYGPYNTIFDTEKEIYDFLKSAEVDIPDSIYINALDYNVYRRQNESHSTAEKTEKVKFTAEEEIQARINRYKGLIMWRKMRGPRGGKEDKLLKKYEKQLEKWEGKMEKLKKKK